MSYYLTGFVREDGGRSMTPREIRDAALARGASPGVAANVASTARNTFKRLRKEDAFRRRDAMNQGKATVEGFALPVSKPVDVQAIVNRIAAPGGAVAFWQELNPGLQADEDWLEDMLPAGGEATSAQSEDAEVPL